MPEQPHNNNPYPAPPQGTSAEDPLNFPEAERVLGEASPNADNSPTIISKNPPAGMEYTSAPPLPLSGNLRGRRLAHFELIEPIGVGGMAAVLRARDTQLDRLVALKILPPDMADEPENVRRFHHEARAAAKLDHENIARVFFCGEDQRLHFIAFEFVEGENLRTIIDRRGRLPVNEAIHYMLQIATGLAHAASRGVVHRDIKPSNIIITPTGRAKLVDMGLARSQQPAGGQDLTQSGVTLGTFDYISPEQALEPRDADVRSDIYSLGCTFYHALTGRPPFPEGTAAKKLHQHQHTPPIDPRQLNPEIPDSVAAILARMMAKNPKDRYQGCEHLVQHLLQVAHELGAPAEVAPQEGVLFVDAPLPSPPRPQAGVLAALAACGLLAVMVVLSFAPPGPSSLPQPHGSGPSIPPVAANPGDVPPIKTDRTEQPTLPAGPVLVRTEQELARALAGKQPVVHIQLDGIIPLGKGELLFKGDDQRTLILEPAPGKKAGLSLSYQVAKLYPVVWAGLIIDGGRASLRNLHLELNGDDTPRSLIAAVAVRTSGDVDFQGCQFSQQARLEPFITNRQRYPAASIVVDNPTPLGRSRPRVALQECLFLGGQTAVAINGLAEVMPTNCAFGPHGALFHLLGEGKPFETRLHLSHCSAFVIHGPVLRIDDQASCTLQIEHSVFTRPDSGDGGNHANLIRQTESTALAVRYTGVRNCYHNLTGLLALPERVFSDWDQLFEPFKLKRDQIDPHSVLLTSQSPSSQGNPLALLATDPRSAFQLRTDLAELRTEDRSRMLGVEQCIWGKTYPSEVPALPAPAPMPVVQSNEKIVDPSGGGPYGTVAGAILSARPGDVILIKHTGLLPIEPVRLPVDENITIRPYQDHRPILTLASSKTADKDAALFWLQRGQLKLERLAFHLEPERGGFSSQSVVGLLSQGQCHFKDCLVTFQLPTDSRVELRLVTLAEVKDGMNMPAAADPRPVPRIKLENCFLRGDGDVVHAVFSKPFELEVEGSLLALEGSLLHLSGTASEMPAGGNTASVRLARTTTYLSDPLLNFSDRKNGKGLLFTSVSATECVFAAGGNKPLIRFEGLDTEERVRRVFEWQSSRKNAYCGFETILELQPGQGLPAIRQDHSRWQMNFAHEADPDPIFLAGKLFDQESGDRLLVEMTPLDFRPRQEKVQEIGASIDQLQARFTALRAPLRPAPANGSD